MYHVVTPDPRDSAPDTASELPDADERPSGSELKKKERVLHTRVPAVLERELKRFAENLRVPVSNLVRTILEDAVTAADHATETVEQRLRRAAGTLEQERERLKKKIVTDRLAGVFAFQSVTLAKPQTCAKCECDLPIGERAHFGLTDAPQAERVFVCDDCLPKPE